MSIKKITALSLAITLFWCTFLAAQINLTNPSDCGLNLPIADESCPENRPFFSPNVFDIQVNNAPGNRLGTNVYLKEVQLIILHEWSGDLDIKLISPGGVEIDLTSDNGGDQNNYGNLEGAVCENYTAFSFAACQDVSDGQAPFLDGPYRPEEGFFLFNDNQTNPNGIWQLQICDDVAEDIGTLEFVNLIFESIDCLPVSLPFISNIDTTTVLINWEQPPMNNCGTTIIEYGPAGFSPNSGASGNQVFTTSDCPPIAITNLQSSTTYDFYIRKQCGGANFSANSCSISATTGCQPPPVGSRETFDAVDLCDPGCGLACSFTGNWRNTLNDDFDWIAHTGPTTTLGTGPESDVSGVGNYVYLETSGNTCNNGNKAYLVSNCINFNRSGTDTCHFSFNYHMLGAEVGSLGLELSTDGGFSWNEIWSKNGNQGDQWHKVYLGLSNLENGQTVQFRFVGTGGSGPKGDIALDDIIIYGSQDLGTPVNQFFVDNDSDGYGDPNTFIFSCETNAPMGFVDRGGDCNDGNELINPDMLEIPCDNVDNNCNGTEDDLQLPPPMVTHDSICTGEMGQVCAVSAFGRPIFWYGSPDGIDLLAFGECYFPEIPENNSPFPITYSFYAAETDFICASTSRTEARITVFPSPELSFTDPINICQGESIDLNSLNIEERNFTGAPISFHNALPPNDANRLVNTLVTPTQNTVYFAVASVGSSCANNINIPVTVTNSPELSFDPGDNLTICKDASASLVANINGANDGFSFQWSNGETTPELTIEAGSDPGEVSIYSLTVTGNNGCSITDTVTVSTISSIDSIQRVITNVTNCDGTNGAITLTPLNSLPPFRYLWESNDGAQSEFISNEPSYTISNLNQGAYRVTITDNSSGACDLILRSVIVNGPNAVINAVSTTNATCNGADDGIICIEASGLDLTYQWSNGATTRCADNLTPGTYTVTITEGTCQTVLSNLVLSEPRPLNYFAESKAPSCSTTDDGMISLNTFGGTPPYSYEWNTGSADSQISSLDSGRYQFTITDANNCQLVDSLVLNEPDSIQIQLDQLRNISCFGLSDGIIRINVSGGTPPYTYNWNSGQNTPLIGGLSAGSYNLTVTDFNNCTATRSYTINSPSSLEVSLVETIDPACLGDNNGSISVSATGGTLPYRFDWQNGIADSVLNNIGAGTYNLVVVDGNNCFADTLSVTLNAQSVLEVGVATTAPTCIGLSDGSITLSPSGTPPFTYNWSNGNQSAQLTNISAGSYQVTVTDAQGCRLDSTIVIEAPQVFNVEFAVFQPSCFNSRDGVINVNLLSSGEAPLAFRWSTGSNTQSLVGINEGRYNLTITSGNGCQFVSDTFDIANPLPMQLQVDGIGVISCFNDSSGFIETSVIGGAPPYTFDWVGLGIESDDLYDLSAGNYRLLVRDINDCPIDTTFVLRQPQELQASVDIETGDICLTSNENRIASQVEGGTAPYQYRWNNGSENNDLLNVPSGDYSLFVEDSNGCIDTVPSVKLKSRISPLNLDTFFVNSSTCSGENDGSMTATISGGSSNYRFHFSNNFIRETNQNSVTATNLILNRSYQVTITDLVTGCIVVSQPKQATEPSSLVILRDSIRSIQCFGAPEGAVFAKVRGGSPPYNFQWFNERDSLVQTDSSSLINAQAGTYKLVVTDANNCTDTLGNNILAHRHPALSMNVDETITTNVNCKGDQTGSITTDIQGGLKPYRYQWSNGALTKDIDSLTAGGYQLTVLDELNCSTTFDTLFIVEPSDSIQAMAELFSPSCSEVADGRIITTISGGIEPYELRWRKDAVFLANQGRPELEQLLGGNYELFVTDANGCQYQGSFILESPLPLTVTIESVPSQDPGEPGGLSAKATGGTPPYIFFWNTNDTTDVASGLEGGAYSLTVTDANGCSIDTSTVLVGLQDYAFISHASIYPNPATNQLSVELSLLQDLDLQILIYDIRGTRLYQETLSKTQHVLKQLNVSNYPPGIYLLQVNADHRPIYTERWIKRRE